MNRTLSLVILCTFAIPCISFAQEYSYTHYGITEGLAGSTVYCITQDKDGFIWAGTETGVSRFDGTHFKNFTTKDGLPDLEILMIFGDSKGRVWMAPFRKSICYYYKGRIYNQENDSLLGRIRIKGNIEGFAEDAGGNILIQERNALHLVGADSSLIRYDSLDGAPVRNCLATSRSSSGNFLAEVNGKIIEFSGKKCLHSINIPVSDINSINIAMTPGGVVWSNSFSGYEVQLFSKKGIIHREWDRSHARQISVSILDDSLVYSNELLGSLEYNIHTGRTRTYLRGIAVSRVFRDVSGDLWFTTMGEGIFRLNSNEWKTVSLVVENAEKSSVTAIARFGNELWVGENHNYTFRFSLPDMVLRNRNPCFTYMARRILFIDTVGDDKILIGGDNGLFEGTHSLHYLRYANVYGLKSAVRIDNRRLLVSSSRDAVILDLRSFQVTDTLWRERTTVVFYKEDTSYIGTQGGLYRSVKGQSPVFLGESTPFLRKRICAIAESSDGIVWIASSDDAGIIGYKNGRQVAAITRRQGLTSDICRTLLVNNNVLWVGTDKGLNRIELDKPEYHVIQYTSRDGLASDMVNTVFIDHSRVYVGTSAGLCFFDDKKMINREGCRLYLLSLINSERDRIADTTDLVIPYTDKHVRFEFAGISYRSAGDITYRYRMMGLDNKWRETKENFLEYPDLPAGNYLWQLVAVNKFGNQSRLLILPLTVATQFWKRTWFILTVWLLSFVLLWLLVSLRIRRIRRQQREKDRLTQRMNALENIALKSQMNPHFIFNCLTSIQQLIFSGEIAASDKYIAGLAKLIRITLNNSSRSFVCIADEVDYLSSYLSLEKMRFKEKIDYELVVDASIDQSAVLIPPMLIQPYVENALQHGLWNKPGPKGFISVKMDIAEDSLIVTVGDNGIGRREAALKKAIQLKGHSPKGMSLTEDRIAILNRLYEGTTSIEIIDLADDSGGPAGTRIVIRLPLFREQFLYS